VLLAVKKKTGEVGQNMGEEWEGKGRGEDGRRRRHLPCHPTVAMDGGDHAVLQRLLASSAGEEGGVGLL
jgi:hypothetical protein